MIFLIRWGFERGSAKGFDERGFAKGFAIGFAKCFGRFDYRTLLEVFDEVDET